MSYTYTTLVAALVAETNIESTNAGFVAILPTIIDQAEGLIYREPSLYFLSTEGNDDTGFTTPNSQLFTLPRRFSVLEDVLLVQGNDRIPLRKTSREFLQAAFTRRIALEMTDTPTWWAPYDEARVMLAQTPGGTFQIDCVGTTRPANISAINPTTWLWTNLADLGFAAAMVFASGYMRNFGSQADDKAMAVSWKGIYDALLPGASTEEMRRRHEAGA